MIPSWNKQTLFPLFTLKRLHSWNSKISCLTQCYLLMIVLIGSAIVMKLMQLTKWLISLLMHTLPSTENDDNEHLFWDSQSLERPNPWWFCNLQWTLLRNVWWGRRDSLYNIFHLFFIFSLQLNEHNNRNLFDSGYNRRGTFIIFKRYAHKTKDTKRNQITEHKVIKMGRKAIS